MRTLRSTDQAVASPRRRPAALAGALVALMALALAACGGGSGATDAPDFSTPAPLETTMTETTDMMETTTP